MSLLDQCYDEKSNSYHAMVLNVWDVETRDIIKHPWQIQDIVRRKGDVVVSTDLLDIDDSLITLDGKVKELINVGYPVSKSYTLVIELTIDDETMDAWWINEFDSDNSGDILFYPERRSPRLKQEITDHQNSKGGFIKVDYNQVDPWEFLDNLAANICILKAGYGNEQIELANKCEHTINHIIELEQLIDEIHI